MSYGRLFGTKKTHEENLDITYRFLIQTLNAMEERKLDPSSLAGQAKALYKRCQEKRRFENFDIESLNSESVARIAKSIEENIHKPLTAQALRVLMTSTYYLIHSIQDLNLKVAVISHIADWLCSSYSSWITQYGTWERAYVAHQKWETFIDPAKQCVSYFTDAFFAVANTFAEAPIDPEHERRRENRGALLL